MKFKFLKRQRKAVCRILILALFFLPGFACVWKSSAEAASYQVYHSVLDQNDYYYVYQNSLDTKHETPTFIKTPNDIYNSENSENRVRITFFRSYNFKNDSQADALCSYLQKQSTAPKCYANWYRFTSSKYGYPESVTIVYLIEGLNPNWDYLFWCLWDWDPFTNANGTTLNLEYGSFDNPRNDYEELWDHGVSAVLTIYGDHGVECSSFGMIFTEGRDRHIVQRYVVYETWD